MPEKTWGTILLLGFVESHCTLAVFGPSERKMKWCHAGTVESLFTDCERIAYR